MFGGPMSPETRNISNHLAIVCHIDGCKNLFWTWWHKFSLPYYYWHSQAGIFHKVEDTLINERSFSCEYKCEDYDLIINDKHNHCQLKEKIKQERQAKMQY